MGGGRNKKNRKKRKKIFKGLKDPIFSTAGETKQNHIRGWGVLELEDCTRLWVLFPGPPNLDVVAHTCNSVVEGCRKLLFNYCDKAP